MMAFNKFIMKFKRNISKASETIDLDNGYTIEKYRNYFDVYFGDNLLGSFSNHVYFYAIYKFSLERCAHEGRC
ncbi:hypothetical protein GCM10023310_69810 [Paenibacillus vulneris]